MKRFFLFTFLILSCLSCKQELEDFIYISDREILLSSEQKTIAVSVHSSGPWRLTNETEWCKPSCVKGVSDQNISFSIVENLSTKDRDIIYIFNCGTASDSLRIVQHGMKPELSLGNDSFIIGSEGETIDVKVKSNVPYEVILPEVTWITNEGSSNVGMHRFIISPNETADNREARIIFKSEEYGLAAEVLFFQLQQNMILLEGDRLEVPADGDDHLTIGLKSNVTVQFEINKDCEEWITLVPESKVLTSENYILNVKPNMTLESRGGSIAFHNEDRTINDVLTISQAGQTSISNTGGNIRVMSSSGHMDIPVNILEDQFTISVIPDTEKWLTAAYRNGNVHIEYCKNESPEERTAILELKSTNGLKIETVRITQDQKNYLDCEQKQYVMPAIGGILEIDVLHNINYKLSMSEWIHLIPQTKGLGKTLLSFRIDPNSEKKDREGFIKISGEGIVKEIKILQSPNDIFDISSRESHFDELGGYGFFYFSSNIPYQYELSEGSDSWISITEKIQNELTRKYSINVSENETPEDRKATITFLSEDGKHRLEYVVTQDQKDILVLNQSFFEVTAAESELNVEVTTNIAFTIDLYEGNSSWIQKVSEDGNNILKFKISENKTIEPRSVKYRLQGRGMKRILTISQEAGKAYLSIEMNTVNVASDGGRIMVKVNSNDTWETPFEASPWCNVRPLYGDVYTKLEINTSRNDTYVSRSCTVKLSCISDNNISDKIVIIQNPQLRFAISDIPKTVTDKASSATLRIETNAPTTVEADKEWCHIEKTGDDVHIRYDANPTNVERSVTITFRYGFPGEDAKDKKIVIKQYAHNNFDIGGWENGGEDNGGSAE